MWKRMHQRLMEEGRCPCGVFHKEKEREKRKRKGKEISHSTLSIVDLPADVQHMHDLQGVSEVVSHLVVSGIKDPDGKCAGILASVMPIDWENNIEPFCLASAISETFLEDP